MPRTTIGSVILRTDGKHLDIGCENQPDLQMSLDAQGIDQLLDFLTVMVGVQNRKRRSFRVPISDNDGLQVHLIHDSNKIPAKPVDISLVGIFVRVESEHWLSLDQDDEIDVVLDYEDASFQCRAIVRRNNHNGYGLCFPDSIKSGEVEAPDLLTNIVMDLQRKWLERRKRNRIAREPDNQFQSTGD